MKPFTGAIFDMDGTLLDSMGVWTQLDIDYLALHHLPVEADYVEAINAMGFRQAAEYTKARYGIRDSVEEITHQWHEMSLAAYRDRVELKPGAREYLRALKEQNVKIALATAASRELYEPAFKRCGIYPLFDAFVTSDEVGRGKEEPDIYLLAAERIGVLPGECCVFEDIYAGIRGAKKAGMQAVGVKEESSAFERAEIIAAADLFITDFRDLL